MKRNVLALALGMFLVTGAHADVKLPSVLGSHMVLQRDKPIPVWGTADPGEEVTVKLGESSEKTKADDNGRWKVTLAARKANAEPQRMTVLGKNTIELEDLLIGEVWVGSGQSNMEWSLTQSGDPKTHIAAANHPQIRLFHVPKVQNPKPADDVKAAWKVCSPQTVPQFSAVLYHFGVRLHKELGVPVGLINSSWGGSPIEPWTVTEKTSGGMYNGMIAPLLPFSIRGVIWYQGESNVGNGLQYRAKKEALISGWRRVWGGGEDFPFYFVQIAPCARYTVGALPLLWEAQVASLKIKNTGMVVTTDLVDDVGDIHPKNKKDVGDRLALWALAKDYGKKDLVYSGPLFKAISVEGDKVVVKFAHTAGGLKSRDGKPLTDFEIAGADGKYVPAEATIEGETVVVKASGVEKPTQVRYGWRNMAMPNLANKEGLPASPFRSENWQGGTGE
jgi:sialate O-acetylesterase